MRAEFSCRLVLAVGLSLMASHPSAAMSINNVVRYAKRPVLVKSHVRLNRPVRLILPARTFSQIRLPMLPVATDVVDILQPLDIPERSEAKTQEFESLVDAHDDACWDNLFQMSESLAERAKIYDLETLPYYEMKPVLLRIIHEIEKSRSANNSKERERALSELSRRAHDLITRNVPYLPLVRLVFSWLKITSGGRKLEELSQEEKYLFKSASWPRRVKHNRVIPPSLFHFSFDSIDEEGLNRFAGIVGLKYIGLRTSPTVADGQRLNPHLFALHDVQHGNIQRNIFISLSMEYGVGPEEIYRLSKEIHESLVELKTSNPRLFAAVTKVLFFFVHEHGWLYVKALLVPELRSISLPAIAGFTDAEIKEAQITLHCIVEKAGSRP